MDDLLARKLISATKTPDNAKIYRIHKVQELRLSWYSKLGRIQEIYDDGIMRRATELLDKINTRIYGTPDVYYAYWWYE